MISKTRYWFLLTFVILVYVAGMFVTLLENDSAQFAVMAMRMVQENDFLSLFKGPEEYLDKPHMHYWLAAISFKIFGINQWAYRIPAILSTLIGAYSCYGLGKLLYHKATGKLAALVFMTAQTIVLSTMDVRTDAVLTGFTIFAIWHLVAFIEHHKMQSIILGAFGAGIAFSTKGQIAILVIGFPILCHLAYTRKWLSLVNWRVLVALVIFAITITPMLYAYYHQFDLHPEKVIRGKDHRSGIFFIFWEQSFERLSGEGVGKNSSDFFFFFHTFLWVFLPWTVLGIAAYWTRLKKLYQLKFKYDPGTEFLTVGGITLIFIIISFAQFKLPHYLNITMPLFSILTASYLFKMYETGSYKTKKIFLGIQYFILAIVFIAVLLLCLFVFKLQTTISFVLLGISLAVIVYFCLKKEDYAIRVFTIGIYTSLLLNAILNLHFYPSLLKYQGGSNMAKIVEEKGIPVEDIYKVSPMYTWALDFYNKRPVAMTSLQDLQGKNDIWVYVTNDELLKLSEEGFIWDIRYVVDQFRITRLQAKFMDPSKRKNIVDKMYLIHIN
ncbi:dolichyl-phosphate-mannose-protein mannosyltransferase [Sediminicola sp. YIK13]|uniref:ArnT family glycosyltransferase n=1 Tax=Sediminicola sp. YIK13 TaxID=1453352 RepID=UPI00071EFA99|nr:glycosyltransferase family 39 protein [Sediminicola sp. YIK13]ALM07569.1 dolichyl-phosphate-mannose-protein mannosyltransferase [Sediminicola sp. YIK13]